MSIDNTTVARTTVLTFTGRSRFGIDQWAYVPFDVPEGVRRISVRADYQRFVVRRGMAANVLDLGVLDPCGFRGWSGGARSGFTVSADDATPGYLPGPIVPGAWRVALGPVVLNPRGMRWRVWVELEHGEAPEPAAPAYPPPAVPDRGAGWYRGDLHVHTVHSDGQRTPAEMAAAARASGLDFIASTEHNTSSANRAWGAEDLDGLLVVPGEEVTTRHGHWLAVGLPPQSWVEWRYRPRDGMFAWHAARVRAEGGLVVAAHPRLPLPGLAWEFGYEHVDAIEVWNGRWTLDDQIALWTWDRLLRSGRRIAAVSGSDSHAPVETVGMPQTVVYAESLSTAAVVEALRAGRLYVAGSTEVTLTLTARCGADTAGPGEDLAVPDGAPVDVVARVTGAPASIVTVRTATGVVAAGPADGELRWQTTGAAARFVRVEVRRAPSRRYQRAPMVALSNPVWLRRG